MSDIEQWLTKNGLENHLALFSENEIDLPLLPHLTDEDIDALGLPIGAKRRLRMAIASLAADDAQAPAEQSTPPQVERRQLTVMFCDLVSSVELGQHMDVEDYRALLAAFRDATVSAVNAYDGFVARHQGDGVLVYFGYPTATENDAERSVRTGLAIVRSIKELGEVFGVVPKVRVGIATGPAVVGDVLATGASEQSEFAALGATPNLAARLQGCAEPNAVVISDATERLCRGLFDTNVLPEMDLKGIDQAVSAFEVSAERLEETRSAVLSHQSLSPLVGREGEIGLILGRWGQAKSGAGQAVLLSAEPGVGKSRLVHEIRRRCEHDDHQRVTFYCSPYHVGSALHPIVDSLARTLDFESGEPRETRLQKLRNWIESLELQDQKSTRVLGSLLSISAEAFEEPLAPDELRRETFTTLHAILDALSAQTPILLIAEDLHWADPTTIEFLGSILERIRDKRVLALMTFRPEFIHPWNAQRNVTNLTLNHLTQEECQRLAQLVLGSEGLPESVVAQIVARSDGVALFVEELSRNLLEVGAQDSETNVPSTLRDALAARLDRLGSAKQIAQLAAVIGRQFRRDWLLAASSSPAQEMDAALDSLCASGLLFPRPGGSGGYEFKHALVRDTAYDSLLRDEKERLHRDVANALSESSTLDDVPLEVLAQHYSAAGEIERAVSLWLQAWEVAHAQGADKEAADLARRALCGTLAIEAPAARIAKAAMNLADSLHRSGHREEGMRVLDQHESALVRLEDKALSFEYLRLMGLLSAFLGKRGQASQYYERAQAVAVELNDPDLTARAAASLITEDVFRGDLRSALARAKPVEHLCERVTEEGGVELRMVIGWAYWWSGDALAGKVKGKRHWQISKQHRLSYSKTHAGWLLGGSQAELGEFDEAIAVLEEALADAAPFGAAIVHAGYAHTICEMGAVARAIPLLEESVSRAREYRSRQIQTWAGLNLALGYFRDGALDHAEAVATEWQQTAIEIGARQSAGRSDWILGLLSTERGRMKDAGSHFSSAKSKLDAAGALGDVARVCLDTASLYARTDRLLEAQPEIQNAVSIWSNFDNAYQTNRATTVSQQLGISIP